jgi:small subunit ribosomal protein S15
MMSSSCMEEKSKTIETYRRHDKDTGSADVQVAILTKKILSLTEHLKVNKKDFSSRRGLLMMVSKRRRLLDYINRVDHKRYVSLTQSLNLRR